VQGLKIFSRFVVLVTLNRKWWLDAARSLNYVVISSVQPFLSDLKLSCCLTICRVVRLFKSSVVSEVVRLSLECKCLCLRFEISPHGWSVWQLRPPLDVDWYYSVVAFDLPWVHFRSDKFFFNKVFSTLKIGVEWKLYSLVHSLEDLAHPATC